jgi:hypothetical protein
VLCGRLVVNCACTCRAECDKFEKGIGVVLRNAWKHVEALQTTDVPALIDYIAEIAEGALRYPTIMETYCRNGDFHLRQEVIVFEYLGALISNLEALGDSRYHICKNSQIMSTLPLKPSLAVTCAHRVMPLLRARRIFMTGVNLLNTYHSGLSTDTKLLIASCLSQVAETEDFATYREEYVRDSADAEVLQLVKAKCLAPFQTEFEKKKLVRALLDSIDRAKRQYKLK